MPFLGAADYLRSLAVFPFTFSANWGGHAVYAGLVGLVLLSIIVPRADSRRVAILMGLLIAAAFVAIYPVAYAILHAYARPRPWYRVPFVIHTLILAWVATWRPGCRRQQLVGLLVVLAVVLPGTHQTRQLWNELMVRAEREARYYLANPDKLLLSEEEAFWYSPASTRYTGWPRSTISIERTRPRRMRAGSRADIHDMALRQRRLCARRRLHRSIVQDLPDLNRRRCFRARLDQTSTAKASRPRKMSMRPSTPLRFVMVTEGRIASASILDRVFTGLHLQGAWVSGLLRIGTLLHRSQTRDRDGGRGPLLALHPAGGSGALGAGPETRRAHRVLSRRRLRRPGPGHAAGPVLQSAGDEGRPGPNDPAGRPGLGVHRRNGGSRS